jgi:hypothetical protein
MWLYMLVGAIAIIAILGGILLGGVFTIVLIPLALIAGGAALAYAIAARAATPSAAGDDEPAPLPTGQQGSSGRVRTSPERLTDARRVQQ